MTHRIALPILLVLVVTSCALDTTPIFSRPSAPEEPPIVAPSDDAGADTATPPPGPDSATPVDPPVAPLRDDALPSLLDWHGQAARSIDDWTLPEAFAAADYPLPPGTELMAVRVVDGPESPGYVLYEAGGGAFSQDFWPASTIKLLAAVGALERVNEMGFSSGAFVTFDSGYANPFADIVERSIRYSNNYDYDRTVRIAGLARLNDVFLTPERGFPDTAIQSSYSGMGVTSSPGITFAEGALVEHVPGYTGAPRGRCPGTGTNCTTLFDLFEGARRVLLDDEVPEAERFAIADEDVALLTESLCGATPSFFAPGVERALGPGAAICHKPGWVPSRDCLDTAMVVDPVTGDRIFILAATPANGLSDCLPLAPMAEEVLLALGDVRGGAPVGRDEGVPVVVQLDVESGVSDHFTIDVEGADRVVLHVDGWPVGQAIGGSRFTVETSVRTRGERMVVVEAFAGEAVVGRRTLMMAF